MIRVTNYKYALILVGVNLGYRKYLVCFCFVCRKELTIFFVLFLHAQMHVRHTWTNILNVDGPNGICRLANGVLLWPTSPFSLLTVQQPFTLNYPNGRCSLARRKMRNVGAFV